MPPIAKKTIGAVEGFFNPLGHDFEQRGRDIISSIQTGAAALNGNGSVLGKTGALLSTGLQSAGAVAGGATDILKEGVNAIAQPAAQAFVGSPVGQAITNNKSVQSLATNVGSFTDAVSKTASDLSKRFPQASKNLQAAGNITNLLLLNQAFKAAGKTPIASQPTEATVSKPIVEDTAPKYYHGTSPQNAESILKNGFDTSKHGWGGYKAYGDSVNLALSPEDAQSMGALNMGDFSGKAAPEIIQGVPKPGLKLYDLPGGVSSDEGALLEKAAMKWNIGNKNPFTNFGKILQSYIKSLGYDGVKTNVPEEGVTIFNPKNVKFSSIKKYIYNNPEVDGEGFMDVDAITRRMQSQ